MKFQSAKLFSLLFIILLFGCTTQETTDEGLYTIEDLKSYILVSDTVFESKYVSHFAKNNLSKGNIIIFGAVTAIHYDISNAQR